MALSLISLESRRSRALQLDNGPGPGPQLEGMRVWSLPAFKLISILRVVGWRVLLGYVGRSVGRSAGRRPEVGAHFERDFKIPVQVRIVQNFVTQRDHDAMQ